MVLRNLRRGFCNWIIFAATGRLNFQWNSLLQFAKRPIPTLEFQIQNIAAFTIAHDRSKEFHWKFNPPVAARMIQLQNPLLRFHKTTKGNFSGEDFQISPTVSFLDDYDSLAQIMPYEKRTYFLHFTKVVTAFSCSWLKTCSKLAADIKYANREIGCTGAIACHNFGEIEVVV